MVMGRDSLNERIYVPLLLGGVSAFTAALVISIYLHPSFNLFSPQQSLSDLGRIGDPLGYIFNLGILISGFLFMVASIANLLWAGDDTLKKLSASVFIFALGLYLLIGVYPKGTPYHNFFAISFFLVSSIAIVLWLVSDIKKSRKLTAAVVMLLLLLSYTFYIFYSYVGFAFAELFGGYTITAWLFVFRK